MLFRKKVANEKLHESVGEALGAVVNTYRRMEGRATHQVDGTHQSLCRQTDSRPTTFYRAMRRYVSALYQCSRIRSLRFFFRFKKVTLCFLKRRVKKSLAKD